MFYELIFNMNFAPVFMDDKRYDVISNQVRSSYKNACILFIDEVSNKSLLDAYELYKKDFNEYFLTLLINDKVFWKSSPFQFS